MTDRGDGWVDVGFGDPCLTCDHTIKEHEIETPELHIDALVVGCSICDCSAYKWKVESAA